MMRKDTFSNFLSGTTKHPRFNQHQVNTFIEFMRDDDVVKSDQLVEVNDNLGNKLETELLIVDDVTDTVMDDVDNSVTSAPAIENIVNNRKEPVKVSPFDFIAETCHSYDDDDEATESNNEITDYELDGDNDSFVRLVDDEKQNVDDWLPDVDPRVGVTMHDYPAYGNLAARVGFYREKWDVLSSYKQIPKRVRDEIMLHAKKCISDKEYGSDWASVIRTPSTRIELTEEECEGEDPYVPVRDEIVRDRKFLGDNIDSSVLVMNSSWSMALVPNLDSELERRVLDSLESAIPDELFPKAGGNGNGGVDEKEVREINHNCTWIDDLRRNGRVGCANGAADNRQPMRRTCSVALSDIYNISDPVNESEVGRKVMKMYVYTCREMPVDRWMSRPLSNMEYAAMLIIWMKCWPYLPRVSRKHPPTACQYCIYQRVLQKYMGFHRDNFVRQDLMDLADEKNGEIGEGETWAGVPNSQVRGSAVIVYSMGNCPMKMIFKKMSARAGADQKKDVYEVEPTFCFRFEKGWICILDCIDDLLMLHSMTFVGVKTCTVENRDEWVRVAMVIRLLETEREFYSDTSTMRLDGECMKHEGKDKTTSDVCRSVFT